MSLHRRLFVPVLALSLALAAARADEVEDLGKVLKKKAYGDYWDRLDALSKLGGIAGEKAATVVATVADDPEPPIREAAALSWARMAKGGSTLDFIAGRILPQGKPGVRATAAWALGLVRKPEAARALEASLSKTGEAAEVRHAAARGLGWIANADSAGPLVAIATSGSDSALRVECLLALAAVGKGDAAALAKFVGDSHAEVRAAALAALAAMDPKGSGDHLQKALDDSDFRVRVAAADALFACLGADAFAPAVKALGDKEWRVRVAAIAALYEVWTKDAVGALIDRMQQEKGRLRFDIGSTLGDMTGKDIGYDPLAWKGWWESNKDKFELPKKPKKRGAREAKGGGTTASFFNIPILSDRIAFVIDFSGSMKNEENRPAGDGQTATQGSDDILKIDIAIQELERCLSKLDPKVKFNVFLMCYAHDPVVLERSAFNKTLVPASPANLKNASKFIDQSKKTVMSVKRGRGDMYDQVEAAFQDSEVDTVIVLSDGKPTYGKYIDEDNFHTFLARENLYRKIMIHAVLTGTKGTDEKFMSKLAGDTGGVFTKK